MRQTESNMAHGQASKRNALCIAALALVLLFSSIALGNKTLLYLPLIMIGGISLARMKADRYVLALAVVAFCTAVVVELRMVRSGWTTGFTATAYLAALTALALQLLFGRRSKE